MQHMHTFIHIDDRVSMQFKSPKQVKYQILEKKWSPKRDKKNKENRSAPF